MPCLSPNSHHGTCCNRNATPNKLIRKVPSMKPEICKRFQMPCHKRQRIGRDSPTRSRTGSSPLYELLQPRSCCTSCWSHISIVPFPESKNGMRHGTAERHSLSTQAFCEEAAFRRIIMASPTAWHSSAGLSSLPLWRNMFCALDLLHTTPCTTQMPAEKQESIWRPLTRYMPTKRDCRVLHLLTNKDIQWLCASSYIQHRKEIFHITAKHTTNMKVKSHWKWAANTPLQTLACPQTLRQTFCPQLHAFSQTCHTTNTILQQPLISHLIFLLTASTRQTKLTSCHAQGMERWT